MTDTANIGYKFTRTQAWKTISVVCVGLVVLGEVFDTSDETSIRTLFDRVEYEEPMIKPKNKNRIGGQKRRRNTSNGSIMHGIGIVMNGIHEQYEPSNVIGEKILNSLRDNLHEKETYYHSDQQAQIIISNPLYIPSEFQLDREIYTHNEIHGKDRPFPRWDSPTSNDDNSKTTTTINSIMDFVQKESEAFEQHHSGWDQGKILDYKYPSDLDYNNSTRIIDGEISPAMTPPINWYLPVILYIVRADGLYTSNRAKTMTGRAEKFGKGKIDPTEKFLIEALSFLSSIVEHQRNLGTDQQSNNQPTNYWPRLTEVLFSNSTTCAVQTSSNSGMGCGSFPFLAHYGDYTGCNTRNWNDQTESLPIFTVAATVSCNHAIPLPNYRTIINSRDEPVEPRSFEHARERYNKGEDMPRRYNDKISQVVWRGSLTGAFSYDGTILPQRCRLLQLVHNATQLSTNDQNMFDVKVTAITDEVKKLAYYNQAFVDSLGGYDPEYTKIHYKMPMHHFQRYKAVIDVDGHSWSSRFSDLLCYSSVVLKVEAVYVDYFYYPSTLRQNRTKDRQELLPSSMGVSPPVPLQPWLHYVPVKSDLSDLVEKTKYVLDPANAEHIESIIHNANLWCVQRLVKTSVMYDVLDVWESYVRVLDGLPPMSQSTKDSPESMEQITEKVNWENKWEESRRTIMDPSNILEMVQVQAT